MYSSINFYQSKKNLPSFLSRPNSTLTLAAAFLRIPKATITGYWKEENAWFNSYNYFIIIRLDSKWTLSFNHNIYQTIFVAEIMVNENLNSIAILIILKLHNFNHDLLSKLINDYQ